jgi:hypothetical protein
MTLVLAAPFGGGVTHAREAPDQQLTGSAGMDGGADSGVVGTESGPGHPPDGQRIPVSQEMSTFE